MSEGQSLQIHRRFFVVASLACVLLLVLTAGVNVAADPTGEFETGWLPPMSESSRDIKVRRLATLDKDTSVLVLGSSRSMRIEPKALSTYFPGAKIYNAALNMADARDFHGVLSLALAKHELPIRDVVIGIDLEGYSPKRGPHRNLLKNRHLLEGIPEAFQPKNQNALGLFAPLNFDKMRMSLKALNYEFVKGWPERADNLREDGVRIYRRIEKEIASGKFNLAKSIETAQKGYKAVYHDFDALDELDVDCLLHFFERCDEQKIRVHCFLTPLHPKMMSYLREVTELEQRRLELLEILKHEVKTRAYRFFDASDIANFGGDPDLYYDGSHMFSENAERMMNALFALPYPAQGGAE